MILNKNNLFHIITSDTSYIIRVNESKHLVLEYYGKKIKDVDDYSGYFNKWTTGIGCNVIDDKTLDPLGNLDIMTLEVSTTGKGDYNSPSLILKNNDGYVFDFTYKSFVINKGEKISKLKDLPTPKEADEELVVFMEDKTSNVELELHYMVFIKSNVIARNIVINNKSKEIIHVLKAMSYELVLNNNNFEVINLYGGWAGEAKKEISEVKHGTLLNDSKSGTSSNRHNPFFMVKSKEANFNNGEVYAFNLIYSGNHSEEVECNYVSEVRIMGGLSPFCFDYELNLNESFETPYAVLTYSHDGLNKASQNMHDFINNHIVSSVFRNKERPILVNNWEATYFKFNESKLISLAKTAKECGIELFVLDDGWFKDRDDDYAGLGNYEVNKKKLPHGLNSLVKKINKIGLDFGLWFEPEMVSENSDLYRAHPDYIINHPGIKASLGRNQYSLDLTKKEVQDFIIENVSIILKSANIKYVKCDYKRPVSDFYLSDDKSGEFFYRYMVGFYKILKEITSRFPSILFEGCASGGNRFDLGVLSYFPQIWASDNTDAYERNFIQSGLYLGYPQSTIGAHVSATPSQSVLRSTPIDTRFNVASFGCLGYELNLNEVSPVDLKAIKAQIKFYKENRKLLQFGTLYQFSFMEKKNHSEWMVMSKDKKQAIYGYFNGLQTINPEITTVRLKDFNNDSLYTFTVREQEHNLKEFGGMINHVLPVHLNPSGLLMHEIMNHKTMSAEKTNYLVSGDALNNGAIKLPQEWSGTGINNDIRILLDFGSRLYLIKEKNSK